MCSLPVPHSPARLVACLGLILGVVAPLGAQPPSPRTDTSRALSITYADGRVVHSPLRRTGGMWTPEFPRIAGAETSRDGLPLTTLDVKHETDGDDAVVTVSLAYGGPGRHPVTVGTVRLSGEAAVEVTGLRAYGVEPIRVSLVPIHAPAAYAPSATSVSGQLFVRAEPVGANASAYWVVVANHGAVPLMWLRYKAYRGDRLAILGRPRGKRNMPLVLPGAEYGFEITTSARTVDAPGRAAEWQPIDRIEVTSLMWQDGTVEGDLQPATEQRRVDQRKAAQIAALVQILRVASSRPLASARQQVATGMDADIEARRARDAVLRDLDGFISAGTSPEAPQVRTWLARTIDDLEQWLARIVPPKA
jgi:hypothetical protein